MKLTIKDRILITSLLPEKSNLSDQIISKGIREKVSIEKEEAEKIKLDSIKDENGKATPSITWNPELAEDVEIEFSDPEINLLKDSVEELNKNKQITFDILSLCVAIKALEISKKEESK